MKLRRVIYAATVAATGFIVAPTVASANHPQTLCSPTSRTNDPYCKPPCESNPQIPASSPDCDPCEWDPSIPSDSDYCYPPETTQPPVETTQPPVETTQPPAETTQPPAETTQPPADTTDPTVPDSTDPDVESGGPTSTSAGTTATTVAQLAPTTTRPVQLPSTGSNNGPMSLIALALLGLGVSIVVVTRRNQQA